MCNGISPIETPVDQNNDLDKMHYAADPNLNIGDWGWSMCGLRRQVVALGESGITCQECAFRMSSYGY